MITLFFIKLNAILDAVMCRCDLRNRRATRARASRHALLLVSPAAEPQDLVPFGRQSTAACRMCCSAIPSRVDLSRWKRKKAARTETTLAA
jgi:hypothetical protein